MRILILIAVLAYWAPAQANPDCGSNNPGAPCTGTSITTVLDGTTFTWTVDCGGDCQMGRFLGGEPWVRHPASGNVSITAVTPDDANSGLEKNPGTGAKAASLEHGLLACAVGDSTYSASLDLSTSLPVVAAPDNGVYVKVEAFSGGNCNYTNAVGDCCVNTATTLTVVQNLPAVGNSALGDTTFRPPMAGDTKSFKTTAEFDLTRLPPYSQITASTDYAGIKARWGAPFPDYYNSINGDAARRWAPKARGIQNYKASQAEQNLVDMWGLFSNDTITDPKRDAAYAMIQYGLDTYAAFQEGVKWVGGAGQHQGSWHPMVFMGALTFDDTLRTNIQAATANAGTREGGYNVSFIEHFQIRRNINGQAIWGPHPGLGCADGNPISVGRYWSDYSQLAIRGNPAQQKGTCGDLYGIIDGPAERPGFSYAECCSTGAYVSIALTMKIWPEFKRIANYPVIEELAERIMGGGWRSLDDPCTIHDPREPNTCNPYTPSNDCQYFGTTWGHNAATGFCVTIPEAQAAGHPSPGPRWPTYHQTGRPPLLRLEPAATYWDVFVQ